MKITIEAENDDERQAIPEPRVYQNFSIFFLAGRKWDGICAYEPASHIHGPMSLIAGLVAETMELAHRSIQHINLGDQTLTLDSHPDEPHSHSSNHHHTVNM